MKGQHARRERRDVKHAALAFTGAATSFGVVGGIYGTYTHPNAQALAYAATGIAVVLLIIAIFCWANLVLTDWEGMIADEENEHTDAQTYE